MGSERTDGIQQLYSWCAISNHMNYLWVREIRERDIYIINKYKYSYRIRYRGMSQRDGRVLEMCMSVV